MSTGELTAIRLATRDGASLHLEGRGGRRDILMLHGLGYASWAAEALRAELDDEIGLWSLDHRGTGRSTDGSEPITMDVLVDDAAHAIDALGGRVAVCGYSMGGYVAQTLTARHPELVDRLVLIATSAGGDGATPVPHATRAAWLDAVGEPPESYARLTMPLSYREGWAEANPDAYERMIRARLAHPTPTAVWLAQYEACERFLAAGSATARLGVPILVLHGDADRVVPVPNGRALAASAPACRYVEAPGAGHLLHLEEPALVADEIRRFLSPTQDPPGNTKE
ncbi:alpha/beta fold hydrolase [Agromyces kandeliae]|uniref:Alpha/beta fold hydrolase n=1 Tax=Agromyces kandeliae TaxID=2666141 RepID=A0A6L5R3J2_9MICO|nr:alpha/beta fold hydrolase [Agromyces kandeliae]MRX44621.1 alpha/beta fold hydrolase [Agromyces kandeliae]